MPFLRSHSRIKPPGHLISPLDVPLTLLINMFALCLALLFSVILPDSLWSTLSVFTVLLAFLFLGAHRNAQRLVCSTLSLQTCTVLGISAIPGGFEGLILGQECFSAAIGHGFRIRHRSSLQTGIRRTPLVLYAPEVSVMWQDSSGYVSLEEPGEVFGALSVVLRGDNVAVDIVFGHRLHAANKVLATRVISSEGCIHSWDASIFHRPPPPPATTPAQPVPSPTNDQAPA